MMQKWLNQQMELPVTQEWLIHAAGLHKLPVHMHIAQNIMLL